MTTTTELAPPIAPQPLARTLTPAAWEMLRAVAPVIHNSRLFGVSSADQAAAIALKGYELGLGIGASFELIQVIQGKPTLSPRGALALALRSGALTGLKIDDQDGACTVWMQRGPLEYTLTWTREDAAKAGLIKAGGAWTGYEANMLRWRAVGFVLDVLFPDVCGGLKRADEMGAMVDEAGDVVVDAQWTPAATMRDVAVGTQWMPTSTVNSSGAPPYYGFAATLGELITNYGAAAVLAANEGMPPQDEAAVARVAAILAAAP